MARRLGIIAALLSILPACPSAAAAAVPAVVARAHHRGGHFHHRTRRHRRRLRHRRARRHSAVVSGCGNADVMPTAADGDLVRKAILCLIDRERTSRGEQPLQLDPDLQQAAQDHTTSMAGRGYFDHVGPGGDTPLSRIRATGYLAGARLGYALGENIAWGTGYLGTPRSIVAGWMASPPHRENILDPRFRATGVGVATHTPAGAGGLYTQDFGAVFR